MKKDINFGKHSSVEVINEWLVGYKPRVLDAVVTIGNQNGVDILQKLKDKSDNDVFIGIQQNEKLTNYLKSQEISFTTFMLEAVKKNHQLLKLIKRTESSAIIQPIEGLEYCSFPMNERGLFQAVSLYANKSIKELREAAVISLEENKKEYSTLINNKSCAEYIKNLKDGKPVPFDLELQVLMASLNRPIIILESGKIRNQEVIDLYQGSPIFVYYDAKNDHCSGLKLITDSRSILEKLKCGINFPTLEQLNNPAMQPIALSALQQDGMLFEFLDTKLKDEVIFITAALRQNVCAINLVDKKHKDLVYKIISESKEIKNNLNQLNCIDNIMSIMQFDGNLIEFINPKFRQLSSSDPDWSQNAIIIVTAAQQNKEVVKFVTGDLIKNKQFNNIISTRVLNDEATVIDLLKRNGLLLEFVQDDLKNNIKVVSTAIKQNPNALQFASNDLKTQFEGYPDYKFVLEQLTDDESIEILSVASLKSFTPFILEAVKRNGNALKFAGKSTSIITRKLSSDPQIVQAAINNKLAAYKFISFVTKQTLSFSQIDQTIDLMSDVGFSKLEKAKPLDRQQLDKTKFYQINHSSNISDTQIGCYVNGRWCVATLQHILGYEIKPAKHMYEVIIPHIINFSNYTAVKDKIKNDIEQQAIQDKVEITAKEVEIKIKAAILAKIDECPNFLPLVFDKDIVLEVMKKNGALLGLVNPKFFDCEKHANGEAFNKDGDIDVIVEAVKQDHQALQLINRDRDGKCGDNYCRVVNKVLQDIHSESLVNQDIHSASFLQCIEWENISVEKIINSVSDKNNKSLYDNLKSVINEDGLNLKHVSRRLTKRDYLASETFVKRAKELVLIAVKQNGMALRFAGDFRKDADVVKAALEQNREAFKYADKSLQNDTDILKLHKRKTGLDFIFDIETIKLVRLGRIDAKNDLYETLQNIINTLDDNVFNAFINRCNDYCGAAKQNESKESDDKNSSDQNAECYKNMLQCVQKLRNHWIEIEKSKDLYAQRQQLKDKYDKPTSEKNDQLNNNSKDQFRELLNELTEKTEKSYLQVIDEYISKAQAECIKSYESKDYVFEKSITKYVVNESVAMSEKYTTFLQDTALKVSALRSKKKIYININKKLKQQVEEQKISENTSTESIKKVMQLLLEELDLYIQKELMLELSSPSNNNMSNEKKSDLMTARAQTGNTFDKVIKEVISLSSVADVKKYIEKSALIASEEDEEIKELTSIYNMYNKKRCRLFDFIVKDHKDQQMKNQQAELEALKKEKPKNQQVELEVQKIEKPTTRCCVSQLNKQPHLPINKFYYNEAEKITFLHISVSESKLSATIFLLKSGADILQKTNYKQNANQFNSVQLAILEACNCMDDTKNKNPVNAIKVLNLIIEDFNIRTDVDLTQLHINGYLEEMKNLKSVLGDYIMKYCIDIDRNTNKAHNRLFRAVFKFLTGQSITHQCDHIRALAESLEEGVIKKNISEAAAILNKKFICNKPIKSWGLFLLFIAHERVTKVEQSAQNLNKFVTEHRKEIPIKLQKHQEILIKHIREEDMDDEEKQVCSPSLEEKKKWDRMQKKQEEMQKQQEEMQRQKEESDKKMQDEARRLKEENEKNLEQRLKLEREENEKRTEEKIRNIVTQMMQSKTSIFSEQISKKDANEEQKFTEQHKKM